MDPAPGPACAGHPGPASPATWPENVAAAAIELSAADLATLDSGLGDRD